MTECTLGQKYRSRQICVLLQSCINHVATAGTTTDAAGLSQTAKQTLQDTVNREPKERYTEGDRGRVHT